jgi:peptide/nickel transport system substrate-binding protein
MESRKTQPKRREFIKLTAATAAGAAALAACAPAPAPAPTAAPAKPAEAPKATEAPKAAAEPTKPAAAAPAAAATTAPAAPAAAPTAAPAAQPGGLKAVARNRTVKVVHGGTESKHKDWDIWNPYVAGGTHQNQQGILFEPLAFYSVFLDKEILHLASSYEYSSDQKTLTIKTRSGVTWTDGTPFSAEDVAYTLTTLKELGPKVKWGIDVQQVLDSAKAIDANTVVVTFKTPNPRFFDLLTYKNDIGVYIVPKHVFTGQDWTSFKNFDLAKSWPVSTGPWKVAFSAPEQKIIDRKDAWWADKAGLAKLPRVERIVNIPFVSDQPTAQALISNEVDFSYGLQPATFPTIFAQNAKVTTWAGQKPPFGNVDWWPISLWLNNSKAPFDDPEMRWAVSYYMDRQTCVDVGWAGASSISKFPFPTYPALQSYVDSIKDLFQKYPTDLYDVKKGDEIMTKKGYKKDSGGMWVDPKGARIKMEVLGAGSSGTALGPVVGELLKRAGFDAAYSQPPDASTRFANGEYQAMISGHGGSIRDPYNTLRLYQSASATVTGGMVNNARFKNADFDKIVDDIAMTPMTDKAKLTDLFRKAMEIWLPNLPDVQLTEFHHRIPMNTTYWKNWPTAENPYCVPASWLLTYAIWLWTIEPTQ